jgi:hypothetical protein
LRKTGFYTRYPGRWAEKEVYEAYLWDRLDGAYDATLKMGMGYDGSRGAFFRRVEAEYLTRKAAVQEQVNEWLTVEYVQEEIAHPATLFQSILAACDEIAHRLDWNHGPKVMLTVLAADTNAPWLPGRFGVFLDKYPYDKICIPHNATLEPTRLHAVVIHEYAHEIVLDLTQGHAPRWLNEMVAKIAEGGPRRDIAAQFSAGRLAWLDARRLDLQYVEEAEDRSNRNLANAYEQSACIGAYLVDLKGERYLAELLRDFRPISFWNELFNRALNRRPSDEALKRAYGMGEREIFARALEWLKQRF